MDASLLFLLIPGFFVLVFFGLVVAGIVKTMRAAGNVAAERKKQDALFETSFPELQPYFHPSKVLDFVAGWAARKPRDETLTWNNPPGLGVRGVRLSPMSEQGQMAELLGEADKVLASFQLQRNPEGGVIRIGQGKLTANLRDSAVRYWHPQREFKWSKLKGWRVINALSDRPIDSSDHGMSFSSDRSSSPSSSAAYAATAAVAGAAVMGAGGAFDGGGSSQSWDDGSSSSESRTRY